MMLRTESPFKRFTAPHGPKVVYLFAPQAVGAPVAVETSCAAAPLGAPQALAVRAVNTVNRTAWSRAQADLALLQCSARGDMATWALCAAAFIVLAFGWTS